MKVVLINPSSNIKYALAYRLMMSKGIPLGIAYIAAVLEKAGMEVSVIDQNANEWSNRLIIEKIRQADPQIVGFSCLAGSYDTVKDISRQIRENCNALITVGNVNASVLPEIYLQDKSADVVIRGQGEYAMLELIKALSAGGSFEGIKGISFRHQGQIIHNPDRPEIADPDELPYPAHHLFDLDDYKDQMFFLRKGALLPVSVSRGCDYNCGFCSNTVVHKKLRIRNPDKIAAEIEFFYNKYKVKTFGLVGAYFPIDHKHTMEFCESLRKRGLHKKIKWFTESRVDKVDPELLSVMKQSGLYFIMYGWDFASQRLAHSMNKTADPQAIKAVMSHTAKQGIISFAYFLVGAPQETEEDVLEAIRQAVDSQCTMAKFNIMLPYPGSRYFEQCVKEYNMSFSQIDKISSWIDFSSLDIGALGLDKEFKQRIFQAVSRQRKAMAGFYFHPNTLRRAFFLLKYSFSLRFICNAVFILLLLLMRNIAQPKNKRGYK